MKGSGCGKGWCGWWKVKSPRGGDRGPLPLPAGPGAGASDALERAAVRGSIEEAGGQREAAARSTTCLFLVLCV